MSIRYDFADAKDKRSAVEKAVFQVQKHSFYVVKAKILRCKSIDIAP